MIVFFPFLRTRTGPVEALLRVCLGLNQTEMVVGGKWLGATRVYITIHGRIRDVDVYMCM